MIKCGGGIGRHKYKFTRIQQSTVGGHARVETTCRKSGTRWRLLNSNREEKDRMLGANPNPHSKGHSAFYIFALKA